MTDDLNLRLEKVEGTLETVEGTLGTVVVLLEGEPILDIAGNHTGSTEGGVVMELERHTEGLNIMSHQLDNILAQLPRCWTRTQRISASMVVVVAFGSISVWAF